MVSQARLAVAVGRSRWTTGCPRSTWPGSSPTSSTLYSTPDQPVTRYRDTLLVVTQGLIAVPRTGRLLEQAVQRLTLRAVECAEHLVLGRGERALGLAEPFEAVRGELHDMAAAVLGERRRRSAARPPVR